MADDMATCHDHLFAQVDVRGGVSSGWGGATVDFPCAGGYVMPPLRARHDLWHALLRRSAADGRAFGSRATKGMA